MAPPQARRREGSRCRGAGTPRNPPAPLAKGATSEYGAAIVASLAAQTKARRAIRRRLAPTHSEARARASRRRRLARPSCARLVSRVATLRPPRSARVAPLPARALKPSQTVEGRTELSSGGAA
eukprot:5276135-Pyramimonas_sp.AAC.2